MENMKHVMNAVTWAPSTPNLTAGVVDRPLVDIVYREVLRQEP